MNNLDSSAILAGNFREEKRRKAESEGVPAGNDFENSLENSETLSLREASLLNKRLNDAGEGKDGLGQKVSTAIGLAANAGTSKLLQAAWENVIDSIGLTLIWVNIHAIFLNPIFGDKYFCKLGYEWNVGGKGGSPAGLPSPTAGGGKASASTGKNPGASAGASENSGANSAVDAASRFRGLGEWMILIGVDLVIVLLLIMAFSIASIVAGLFGNMVTAVKIIFKIMFS